MLIEPDRLNLDFSEVQFLSNIEQILADDQWIDDATGLVPHCLAILKTCRSLTEKLTGLAMGVMHNGGGGLTQIIEVCMKQSY